MESFVFCGVVEKLDKISKFPGNSGPLCFFVTLLKDNRWGGWIFWDLP